MLTALLTGCVSVESNKDLQAQVRANGRQATLSVQTIGIKTGTGAKDNHVHFRLDDGPDAMLYGPTYTLKQLTPAKHQLKVWVADANHVSIPGLEKTILFDIK